MVISIKTSVIDYIGETNTGVSIQIGLTVAENFTFDSIYWIHPSGKFILEADDIFLKLFGVTETIKLPFLRELLEDINSILPPHEEIFKEFLV